MVANSPATRTEFAGTTDQRFPHLRRRSPVIVALAVAGIVLSECGGSPAVSRSEVEHQVARSLGAAVHRAPPHISCPSDLPAKVGATVHCVLSVTGDSTRYAVTVRVTSVSGSNVRFHSSVATTPLPAGSG